MVTGSGGKILVVEDDDGMREAVETLLDAAGFETVAYRSAEAFFSGTPVTDALCVITDLKLPAMSGFALLTRLRRSPAATGHRYHGARFAGFSHRSRTPGCLGISGQAISGRGLVSRHRKRGQSFAVAALIVLLSRIRWLLARTRLI